MRTTYYPLNAKTGTNNLTLCVDPCSRMDNPPMDILEWCGLLPLWVSGFATLKEIHPESEKTLKEYMTESYGFGELFEMTGGEVKENGTYHFPEDPVLYPLLRIETADEAEFIQWHHGICAMRDSADDKWFVTRMD